MKFSRFEKRNNILCQFSDKKVKSFCKTQCSDQFQVIDSIKENLPKNLTLLQKKNFSEPILPITIAQKMLSIMLLLTKVIQKVNDAYNNVKKYI